MINFAILYCGTVNDWPSAKGLPDGTSTMNPWIKWGSDLFHARPQNAFLGAFRLRLDWQRYGDRFAEFLVLLEQTRCLEPSRMGSCQDKRLRHVIRHAYALVPCCGHLFNHHGIDPAAFLGHEGLARIRVATRMSLGLVFATRGRAPGTGGALPRATLAIPPARRSRCSTTAA